MELKYLVIHCTATPEGREVTAADIRRWHTSPTAEGGRGWRQVGYTDMLHLDGTFERLVANNEDAFVDGFEITNGAAGYNGCSRHIVYVGGLASDARTPRNTMTAAQARSLAEYVRSFHAKHPSVRIIGHNEISAKACPSFDVQKWLKSIGIVQ